MGNVPYWLQFGLTFAEEGDGATTPPAEGADEDPEDEADEEEEEAPDTAGLKSALRKERIARRTAERERNTLKKAQEERDNASKSETERATASATSATAQAVKLASSLKTNATNLEIIKAARGDLAFADIDDALALIDRNDLDVEQDEEDPSQVRVDSDSIKNALKALLKRKPHLKAAMADEGDEGTEGHTATGGKVGSRGTRDTGKLAAERLKELYPQLRR